jgi:hypothetical protein
LGASEYVRQKLNERFVHTRHPVANGMVIIPSTEPQLAVAKGLVEDRRQKLEAGDPILTKRIARASYGVICSDIYDPKKHLGDEVVRDQFDRRIKRATKQIYWLIRKVILLRY